MKPDIDLIICFGKSLFTDLKPDWFLESRLLTTIEIARKNVDTPIVLTGGKSHLIEDDIEISEAEAMKEFILERHPEMGSRIILEDKGDSTIHQIIKIKLEIITKRNFKKIGVVTDEIHMPRVEATTSHILGDNYEVIPYSAIARISGTWRKAIEEVERTGYELTLKTRINKIQRGDHKKWQRLNEEWKSLPKEEKEKILNIKY